ncbi:MAG: S9 family peptidase [Bacteroidia bacterium]|nr:S9 family peptidase [Bacteroidia bacterium]
MNFKKIAFALSLIFIYTFSLNAQGTKYLSMEDAILMVEKDTKKALRPLTLAGINWLPGGSKYAYVKTGIDAKLMIVEAESGKVDSSNTLDVVNKAIMAYKSDFSFKVFPVFEWIDNDNLLIQKGNIYLIYNISAKAFRNLISLSENAEYTEKDGKNAHFAYIENDNIHIATNEKVTKITSDGGKGIVYGQTVHRSEFGIHKGLFWSPSGNKLAFYRMDESMVTDYAIYDNRQRPAGINNIKYPIAGAKSHTVTLGIYDLKTGKTTYMETGEPKEQYLTNITWGPDEEFIYIAIVNRGQNQCFLNRYNVENGVLDLTLFEERDEKYVEPQNDLLFLSNETNKFIWQSERDGYNHLYLFNNKGKLIRQLTSGKWVVTRLIGVDPRGEYVYFEGTKESPIERHIYKVNIDNGEMKKLSSEAGTHAAQFNSSYSYFIDALNSLTIPRQITLKDRRGETQKMLFNAPNPLEEYKLGETSIIPILNDNNVLYSRLILPPGFDKTKKYPVVVYVYGGPHVQLVTNSWLGGSNLWMQLMAQKGYIVFTIDGRGSANRGHGFESAVHRQLGTLEMNDQMAGINYLKNLPYVDANRIGVHGWSFGGFMTTTLMSRQPGVFKVGVAGGPVIDWGLYEIMYTERYMDTPEENPEGYKNSNLINYVNSLQDKLLMIHGCDDDVVLWQHSLLYCKAAVDVNNTYLDYFVYPGHKHNVLGRDRVHLMQKITEYIIENL